MRWLRFAFLIALFTFVQGSNIIEFVALTHIDARPNFLVILLVFFATIAEGKEALIASFALGLGADLISPLLGPNIIAYGLCGSMLSNMRRVITLKKFLHIIAAVFVVTIVIGIITNVLMSLKGQNAAVMPVSRIIASALYSGLIAPYVFAALNYISGWIGIKSRRHTDV